MFPSATVNGVLHAYAEQYLFDHASPSSRNDPSSSFFHFSPAIDHINAFLPHEQDPLDGHFPQPLLIANSSRPATTEAVNINTTTSTKLPADDISLMGRPVQNFFPKRKNSSLASGRNRGSKKDRHSKIFTAQGPRDRRMRLSLEIAREFFDLQDMLGFDKASKTVDWLLTKSKAAIKQLARDLSHAKISTSGGAKSVSSTSEGEVVSGIDDSTNNADDSKEKSAAEATPKVKRSRQSRKATFNPLSKEWRAIARARARERTRKKMMIRRVDSSTQLPHPNTYDLNQLTSLSTHEAGEESVSHGSHNRKSSSELLAEVEEPTSYSLDHQTSIHDTVDELLPVTCRSGTSIFEYHQKINTKLGVNSDDLISLQNNEMINFLPGNWDMDSARAHSSYCAIPNVHLSAEGNLQERISGPLFKTSTGERLQFQFTDVQFCTKPWEGYNY